MGNYFYFGNQVYEYENTEVMKKKGLLPNDTKYIIKSQESSNFPKMGNILMPIINKDSSKKNSIEKRLSQIYNGDLCGILFNSSKETYDYGYDTNYYHFIDFMEYFFYNTYLATYSLLEEIENDRTYKACEIFDILIIIYIVICLCILCYLLYLFQFIKKKFYSFLFFVIIFPMKYLQQDERLYNQIIKLHKKLYI